MLPTAVRKENLAVAYSIIGGIPAKNFHLDRFSTSSDRHPKPTCGTIGCALGWLAMHPYFVAQGLVLRYSCVHLETDNLKLGAECAAEYLFGRQAFDKYFDAYGAGHWDDDLCKQIQLPSSRFFSMPTKEQHKTLALARLKRGYKRIH